MFFPERMKRVRFLVHDSIQENYLKDLHQLGCVQVTARREGLAMPELEQLLTPRPAPSEAKGISSLLLRTNRLLDTFRSILPEKETGFFRKVFSPSLPNTETSEEKTELNLESAETQVREVEGLLSEPLSRLESTNRELTLLNRYRLQLERIRNLELPLELLQNGVFAGTIAGFINRKDHPLFLKSLGETLKSPQPPLMERGSQPPLFLQNSLPLEDGDLFLVVSCLMDNREACLSLAKRNGLEILDCGTFTGEPKAALQEIDTKTKLLESERENLKTHVSAQFGIWSKPLRELANNLRVRQERLNLLTLSSQSGSVSLFEGWVVASDEKKVQESFRQSSKGLVACFFSEPDVPVEKVPVKLNNPGIVKHFEPLTRLYAQPRYDEFDPTVLLAFTSLFFFGLMITDAPYGLFTMLLGIMVLRGGGKTDATFRTSGILLILGGISAFIQGTLGGGWLGNLGIEHLGFGFLERFIVLDPLKQAGQFLVLAIAIGILHINFAILLGIIKEVRRGNPASALDNLWIFFFEAALVANHFYEKNVALAFLVPGAVLLLSRSKGMTLFAVTGFIGDILSYSRLMALGMVSFGLAFSINTLAMMVWDLGSLGWIPALLILVIGHTFSWVLNVVGAFAHTLRLHFVEFFGKFHEGGGNEFVPFTIRK